MQYKCINFEYCSLGVRYPTLLVRCLGKGQGEKESVIQNTSNNLHLQYFYF